MALSFNSLRLKVSEITADFSASERAELITQIPEILSPCVVESLPPHFQGIHSSDLAETWLDRMLSESRLLLVRTLDNTLIGFLFIFSENNRDAHIGYLLSEIFWGQGLATELLENFIAVVSEKGLWSTLIGGVESSNTASISLLKKLNFVEQTESDSQSETLFYSYSIN